MKKIPKLYINLSVVLYSFLWYGLCIPQYLPESTRTASKELACLVDALYGESRGEPTEGVLKVAEVILNRTASKQYPDSICRVTKQPWQFSYYNKSNDKRLFKAKKDQKSLQRMYKLANKALTKQRKEDKITLSSSGVLFYHTTKVKPKWSTSPKLKYVKTIKNHKFYRES